MKNYVVLGMIFGIMGATSVAAQTIELGLDAPKAAEETAKPNVEDLPQIQDLTNEQSPSQEEVKKQEGGLFSFLNFFKKDDKELEKEAKKNQESILDMLTRKAAEGNVDAQLSLGYMYLYGDASHDVKQDYKKSFDYYSMAAAQGDSIAINNLGSLYYSGIGVEKNMEKAAELFAVAADKGNEESALNLAFLYLSGNGVSNDNRKAMDYFVQSAQKGNLVAKFMLGYAYYRGFVVPQDFKRAFNLMKDAAKAGYDDAQLFMGLMYLNGEGTNKNYGNAVKYLGNAFLQGNVNATAHLAKIYAEGKAYPKNIFQAYTMYNIAANSGVEEAAEQRDTLEKALKIEELLKAQSEAENFTPKPTEITTYIRKTFGRNIFSYISDQMPTQYIKTPEGELQPQTATSQRLI